MAIAALMEMNVIKEEIPIETAFMSRHLEHNKQRTVADKINVTYKKSVDT
jgi:hypothetical protein